MLVVQATSHWLEVTLEEGGLSARANLTAATRCLPVNKKAQATRWS